MNDEQKTEIFEAEHNAVEKSGSSRGLNLKKWGIIGSVALIIIALIVGIGVYNSPSNKLSRQLDLGNRYLEEQNYEQAIVEFDKAIAIDPMSVEAYLGKANAYIGLGDLQSALYTLQTGYDLTGDERLKAKFDELNYIELSFSVSDITIMGYDLLEPHFDELAEVFGIPMEQVEDGIISQTFNQFGFCTATDGQFAHIELNGAESGDRWLRYEKLSEDHSIVIVGAENENHRNDIETICNLPILPGDTYEQWCEMMNIEKIKGSAERRINEVGASYWEHIEETQRIYSKDNWYVQEYSEWNGGGYFKWDGEDYETREGLDVKLVLFSDNESEYELHINCVIDDGVIVDVSYSCWRN